MKSWRWTIDSDGKASTLLYIYILYLLHRFYIFYYDLYIILVVTIHIYTFVVINLVPALWCFTDLGVGTDGVSALSE